MLPDPNVQDSGGIDEIQDVTGPLPPLYPDSKVARGGTISSVPGKEPGQPLVEPDVPPVQEAPKKSGRGAEQRIAQLTRKMRSEERANSQLQDQIQAQTAEILKLQQTVSALQSRPQVAPTPQPAQTEQDQTEALLAGSNQPVPGHATPLSQPTLTQADIQKIIRDELQNARKEAEAHVAAQNQLLSAHEDSFKEALQDFPELADQNSNARKLFNQLYDNSPLAALPDAPLHIALQVKGILSEQRSDTDTDTLKRQTSVIAPQPTGPAELGDSKKAQLKKVLQAALDRRQAGDNSFETYATIRKARMQLGRF